MTGEERPQLERIKPNLERRALIYRSIRNFFTSQDFLEVDTPIRVPVVAPESNITPISAEDWFLSTSPELHMKRLLAAGYERLFQICHCFRKGEQGRWHNPEFTMIEWYRIGADYRQMIADTEQLVWAIATTLQLGMTITYQKQKIDLSLPWPRITVHDAFVKAAGWDPVAVSDAVRFDEDLVTKVVPSFQANRPTVLMDYPASMASLSRLKQGESEVAERAEVFIGGLEIANAFSELTDAREQEQRFLVEIEQIEKEHKRRSAMPLRFIDAVKHLPQCGGIALGVDRLVMLFCDAGSIVEVMAFTEETA